MQYQIGEFARMAQISTKLLKYYEQCGLITPVRVDESSGYRFYEAEQLRNVAHIRAFLSMGFTTAEIKALLPDGDYTAAFDEKQKQLDAEMDENRRKHTLLSFYRDAIRNSGFNQPYRATIKTTPIGLAAAERRIFSNVESMTAEWTVLEDEALCVGAVLTGDTDALARFFDNEFTMELFDAELLLPLKKRGDDSSMFAYKLLEPKHAVNVIHYGSYDFINEAYAFAYIWADRSGYRPDGLPIEHYRTGPSSDKPVSEYVTELYIPIAE